MGGLEARVPPLEREQRRPAQPFMGGREALRVPLEDAAGAPLEPGVGAVERGA